MTYRGQISREAVLMEVLLLGGSGRFAEAAARCLAESDLVSGIGVAGRSEAALRRRAAEVGEKAHPVVVDILDEPRLAEMARSYDILVNAAGPEWEVLLPALRAAIRAGTHYCDLGADGRTAEKQLGLDLQAKDAGILAVVGIGFDPGIDNLLAVQACRQFDRVEAVTVCYHLALPDDLLREAVDGLRRSGRVDPSWQMLLGILAGPVPVFRAGAPVLVRPEDSRVETVSPAGHSATAYPVATPEQLTLPRYIPGVRDVTCVCGISPRELSDLVRQEASKISTGQSTVRDATRTVLRVVGDDPDRWLSGNAPGWDMWLEIVGAKGGRRCRYTCWPVRVDGTGVPLAVSARKILRNEVPSRGVLPPEACFEPEPFFEEVARFMPNEDRHKPWFGEKFDWGA